MNLPKLYTFVFIGLSFCRNIVGQPFVPPEDSSQAIADRIVQSEIPVLVDFWAAWCGPCRILNPIIAELEETYKDKVLFIKVNVDIHRALSSYFGVSSIPAVFIIHKKSVVQALPGVQPKENYIKALDTVLKGSPSPPVETGSSNSTGSSLQ
jgi:thioredoxin 1